MTLWLLSIGAGEAFGFSLTYAGRLTDANGKTTQGPVNLELTFFATDVATSPLIPAITKNGVVLAEGVFSVVLDLDDDDVNAVFADPANPPWIQVKLVNGKTYPRQRFGVVPFALRVPNQVEKSYVDTHLGGFPLTHSASSTDNFVVKWDADTDTFYLGQDKEGLAGGGITTLNGVNGANQTLAIGTSGTAPAWTDDGVAQHVLNLPNASAAGVTAGLLSKAKFDEFDAKVDAADARLTNARDPTAHAASHRNGGADEVATANPGANAIPKAGVAGTLGLGWLPSTLTGKDADTVDGSHGADLEKVANKNANNGYAGLNGSGQLALSAIPTTLTGKDADTVDGSHGADLEKVANKNASNGYAGLDGSGKVSNAVINWAAPSAIGGTTPAAGSFTTLNASGNLTTGGNLGVGSASPGVALDVVGLANFTNSGDRYRIKTFGGGLGTQIQSLNTAESQYRPLSIEGQPISMQVANSSGNVGIGTDNPTAKLEVSGQVKITGGSPGAGKVLTSDAAGLASWQASAAGGSGTWQHVNVQVYNAAAPTVWTDLNLSSQVGANHAMVMLKLVMASNLNSAFRFKGDTGEYVTANAYTGTNRAWGNATNQAMTITSTDANGVIQWKGDAAAVTQIYLVGYTFDGYTGGVGISDNADAVALSIDSSERVGIGQTVPTAKLHVGGTAGFDGIRYPDGTLQTTAGGESAHGTYYKTGAQSFGATATWYNVTFNNEAVEVGVTHDNVTNAERVTVPATGTYQITYSVNLKSSAAGSITAYSRLTKGGTEVAGTFQTLALTATNLSGVLSNSVVIAMTAGDYVALQAGTNNTPSAVDVHLTGGPAPTTTSVASLTIVRIK